MADKRAVDGVSNAVSIFCIHLSREYSLSTGLLGRIHDSQTAQV